MAKTVDQMHRIQNLRELAILLDGKRALYYAPHHDGYILEGDRYRDPSFVPSRLIYSVPRRHPFRRIIEHAKELGHTDTVFGRPNIPHDAQNIQTLYLQNPARGMPCTFRSTEPKTYELEISSPVIIKEPGTYQDDTQEERPRQVTFLLTPKRGIWYRILRFLRIH